MLPGNGAAASVAIAERIRARIESTIISIAPGITDHITVSIGCATAPEQGLDRITLLRLADEALYEAKGAGRNRVAAAARAAGTPTVETLSTEAAIIAVLPAA
jgi:diguanylate cyclase (GGDEF)-like protein